MKRLTKKIEDRLLLRKKTIREVLSVEEELINQLIASRKDFIEKCSFGRIFTRID
jgi:hypothetical protein